MGRSAVLLHVLCAGLLAVNAEEGGGLFSFGGLDSLRDPECVPESYRLPQRVSDIADRCQRLVEQGFDDLDSLNNELAALNDPTSAERSMGSSVHRFQLGLRDCIAEKMGILDDNGDFIKERVVEEIDALGFPESFERDVQSTSRSCLRHTPENLSVEQRQNFYYVCRDSLLEANCLYKRLAREDPDRALDIGIQQTQCLEDLKPTATVTSAMDQCKAKHNVPVQYATLRRRRSVDEEAMDAPEASDEGEESPDEAENELALSDRVNLFVYCVYETIGALQPDGRFNAAPLIEELKQFQGDEKAVELQVFAASHCQDRTSIEEFNSCYYDDVSSVCHIFKVQQAFLAGDPDLLPKY